MASTVKVDPNGVISAENITVPGYIYTPFLGLSAAPAATATCGIGQLSGGSIQISSSSITTDSKIFVTRIMDNAPVGGTFTTQHASMQLVTYSLQPGSFNVAGVNYNVTQGPQAGDTEVDPFDNSRFYWVVFGGQAGL